MNKKQFLSLGLACVTALTFAAGCGDDKKPADNKPAAQTQTQKPAAASKEIDVEFSSVKVEKKGDDTYVVSGKTNLPDGMKLSLHISNWKEVKKELGLEPVRGPIKDKEKEQQFKDKKIDLSGKMTAVKGGAFSTEIKDRKGQLAPGNYVVIVRAAVEKEQPEEVKTKLGEKFVNLKPGKHVAENHVLETDIDVKL